MKQIEHRRAVEKLIEDRKAQFQQQKVQFAYIHLLQSQKIFYHIQELELLERQEEERMEAIRRSIVEQERQKLLQEHASKLLGYLPKVNYTFINRPFHYGHLLLPQGVFKGEQDLEKMPDDFRETYKKRQVDIFSDEGWQQQSLFKTVQ